MVEEIKSKRKKLDLTQKDLSKRVGVSQSLIAKLEQKKNIPNYQTMNKIYDFLERKINNVQKNAGELANTEIISLSPKDTRKAAAELMDEKNLAAVPVEEDGNFIGVVRSSSLTLFSEETPVKEIMDYSFSIVSNETSQEAVRSLYKNDDLILVHEKGEIIGFISGKDLI